MNVVHYEIATGRIETFRICLAEELPAYATPGFAFLEVERPPLPTHYVANGAVVPRPANPTTIAGTILSNVPVPAVVSINGTPFATADASVDLGLTLMGTYKVVVKAFPYLDKTFTVVVA